MMDRCNWLAIDMLQMTSQTQDGSARIQDILASFLYIVKKAERCCLCLYKVIVGIQCNRLDSKLTLACFLLQNYNFSQPPVKHTESEGFIFKVIIIKLLGKVSL